MSFKPRNKYLHHVLATRKGGAHDAKAGKHVKRAKANREVQKELRRADD
jgi:hypothetical protein